MTESEEKLHDLIENFEDVIYCHIFHGVSIDREDEHVHYIFHSGRMFFYMESGQVFECHVNSLDDKHKNTLYDIEKMYRL